MTEWEPATQAEAAMRDALRTGDQELYFRILARVELLLPISPDALSGNSPTGWGTWTTGGRTHVLAFTSPQAMRSCLAEHTGSARSITYPDLASAWPNHEWWLAINPGLPIEGYLPAWFVAQLSRGDVRLPGRTIGARARVEAAAAARARGAAPVPPPSAIPRDPAGGEPETPGRYMPERVTPDPLAPAPRTGAPPTPSPAGHRASVPVQPAASVPAQSAADRDELAGDWLATRASAGAQPPAGQPPFGQPPAGLPPSNAGQSGTRLGPSGHSAEPRENRVPGLRAAEAFAPRTSKAPGTSAAPRTSAARGAEQVARPVVPLPPAPYQAPPPVPLSPAAPPLPPYRPPVAEQPDDAPVSRYALLEQPYTPPASEPYTPPHRRSESHLAPESPRSMTPPPFAAVTPPPFAAVTPPPFAAVAPPEVPASQPEPPFEPANEVEIDLLAAAADGQTDSFLSTLLLAKVLLPVPPGGSRSKPGQPGFDWRREDIDGQPYVVVFTSPQRMVEHMGSEDGDTVSAKFVQLIRVWPDETWSFAVNPGSPVGATLPGTQIRALASWAAEVGLTDEPSVEFEAAVSPAPAVVVPRSEPTTTMQKPVAPTQVAYYLERGYDRVSGFVHRASEVAHLSTPEQMYAALGLGYAGSPFKPSDDEVYVLRWTAYRPNLYRIPYGGRDESGMRAMQGWMIERPPYRGNGFAPGESTDVIAEFKVDSARLPYGAQMWRLTREGQESLIALLDSDGPRWLPIPAEDGV